MTLSRLCRSLLLSSLLFSSASHALQIVDALEGRTIYAKISSREPSRISLENGRIRTLKVDPNELTIDPDTKNGQAFIIPRVTDKEITVFVLTEDGKTFTLLLQPVDVSAENVVLRDLNRKSTETPKIESLGSYERVIRNFMIALATNEHPDGLDETPMQKEFALWANSRLIQTAELRGRSLIGEKYMLYNTGDETMRVAEQEFYRSGVVAIAVSMTTLEPGDSTEVYIVRSPNGEK